MIHDESRDRKVSLVMIPWLFRNASLDGLNERKLGILSVRDGMLRRTGWQSGREF